MPAITTRQTLYDAVTAFLARSDLTSNYDLFLDLAEKNITRRLEDQTSTASNLVSISTADDSGVVSATVFGIKSVTLLTSSGDMPLTIVPFAELERIRAEYGAGTAMPRYASVMGDHFISVAPAPDQAYIARLSYSAALTPIPAGSSGTTPELVRYPDLYLYAMLREAAEYLEDPREEKFERKVAQIIHDIRVQLDIRSHGTAQQRAALPAVF